MRAALRAITALFQQTDPLALGVSTGWPSLDNFYRVAPGEVTIVTGIPNSGKSEWLDALMVNLAENHGWAFCVCSMEKELLGHVKMLVEKRVRKPFRDYVHSTPTGPELIPGMSAEEMRAAFNWVADHFFPLRYAEVDDTGAPTIDWVLDMARVAVLRHGVRGLLIDPYNELDSRRQRDQSETEFIKGMLTKVRRFARDTECHVWFVAHPRQQQRGGGGGAAASGHSPGMYDISGSAHWFNKTDNGIVVHRWQQGSPAEQQQQPAVIDVDVDRDGGDDGGGNGGGAGAQRALGPGRGGGGGAGGANWDGGGGALSPSSPSAHAPQGTIWPAATAPATGAAASQKDPPPRRKYPAPPGAQRTSSRSSGAVSAAEAATHSTAKRQPRSTSGTKRRGAAADSDFSDEELAQLEQLAAAEEAAAAWRRNRNGSNLGFELQDDLDHDDDDEDGGGGGGGGRARRRQAAALSGGQERRVVEVVDGREVPAQTERLTPVDHTLAENEGIR
ncbi:hypothetical protein GPECTOR_35g888 [Gonium pectorale]|uniref:SF4 helicase domain-containing protein n=1 Tax=Gonium pectorale TaxID=33097 RepID=A0A150GDN4_GONPE|nr:hypothetical protein GPECTOR_35g888 [Gonium pectorale]|eukprot:KXZ47450.1 hypothetical protein GPECTOR_35g888 [Gonium pectorale]